MTSLPDILHRLALAKPTLQQKYPLATLGVFGSYSRGEARPESDVDILVEFSRPVGFEIADLAVELEELLGVNVDIVSKKAISERMMPFVQDSLILVE
jgi:predicted nucleotidyltransferase